MTSLLNRRRAGLAAACVGGLIVTACGGVVDEVQGGLAANTPLSIGALKGPKSYTTGTAQSYNAAVIDPDGITQVSATIDGQSLSVISNAPLYGVTLPASTSAGTHTLVLTAVGTAPDGSSEIPQNSALTITIFVPNTPLTISPISGPSGITFGLGQTYVTSVLDPDGITNVGATLDGAPIAVAVLGANYSVTVPPGTATGSHLLTISATGQQPDGSVEATQSVSRTLTVSVADTPTSLSGISEIAGPAATVPTTIFRVTAGDADGPVFVTATFDGAPFAVTQLGSVYSIQMVTSAAHPGPHTVVFTAVGTLPDGSSAPAVTATLFIP